VYVGSQAAKMTTTGGDGGLNQLDVVSKVPWHQTMQASVHGQLKVQ